MQQGHINPAAQRAAKLVGDTGIDEVWFNDVYDCQVRYLEPARLRAGAMHLSIKRMDRAPVRDWRHLQSIKNEICGWGREALELYPAESRLVDGANQTHLWVMAAGEVIPIGFLARAVGSAEDSRKAMAKLGFTDVLDKGRQRPWQPGLSTGPDFRPQS